MFSDKKASLINELLGLEAEMTLFRSNPSIPNSGEILSDLARQRNQTTKSLESRGVSVAKIEHDGATLYEPIIPDNLKRAVREPEQKDKRKKYFGYVGAGLMIGAAVLSVYGLSVGFESWKGLNTHSEQVYNEINPKRRDEKNNTTENPIIDAPQNQTQNPNLPQNHTEVNQTLPNQTLPIVDTPDYLKYFKGVSTGDVFFGRYEIVDAQHNPDGNYSMRVRDSQNKTVFEIDLNDTEGEHNFQFETDRLKANEPHFVEILRNGTLAGEPFKLVVPNSPPTISLQASAKLGLKNESRILEYSAEMKDDRGLQEADFDLYDNNGSLVQPLKNVSLQSKGTLFNGVRVIGESIKAGIYHVVGKVYDTDRAQTRADAIVDIPALPILPPPPPPPPPDNNGTTNKTHFPPIITSAKMYIDRDTGKAIADLQITDPDSDQFYLDQNFKDNQTGENLIGNVTNRTTMSGHNIHEEVFMQNGNPDGVYNWEMGVSDGENRTNTTFKEVWNWMRDLLGYWKFDGNGSDYMRGNNLTHLDGMNFIQGKKNQALHFDGVYPHWAVIPNSPAYAGNDFTISEWFNPEELAGRPYATLFNKHGWGGLVIATYNNPDGRNTIRIFGTEAGTQKTLGETPNLDVNTWYLLTFSYDGGDKKAKTYLNGELVDSQNVTGEINLANPSDATFGANFGSSYENYFKGMIDDLRIYGRALSDRIVRKIFQDV